MFSLDSNTNIMDTNKASVGRIRVVVVDDHPAIREAIADIISDKMGIELVGQASTADEAFQLVEKLQPDVAVIDISLEDAHGLDLVQNIKAQYPNVQVVVFSMYDESVYAERAIRAGASTAFDELERCLIEGQEGTIVIKATVKAERGPITGNRPVTFVRDENVVRHAVVNLKAIGINKVIVVRIADFAYGLQEHTAALTGR